MASKRNDLNPAEQATAQHMACSLIARLGSRLASVDVKCSPSLVWRWANGRSSPTKAKFRELQAVYEKYRSEK